MASLTGGARCPTGITIGLGASAVVASTLMAAAVPTADADWRLGVVAAAVALVAALSPDLVAVSCTVVLAWLVVNGFLINRYGELSWHGASDLIRAATLVLAGGLGHVVGQTGRLWRRRRAERLFAAQLRALVDHFGEERTRNV